MKIYKQASQIDNISQKAFDLPFFVKPIWAGCIKLILRKLKNHIQYVKENFA